MTTSENVVFETQFKTFLFLGELGDLREVGHKSRPFFHLGF